MADFVSVVVPLYNKERWISRAVQSVLAQTHQNFELILIDDGSTDNGAEIVRGYEDSRIRIISKDNGGVSSARNLGIKVASGHFIAFLDADDEWRPFHLEVLLKGFELNDGVVAVCDDHALLEGPVSRAVSNTELFTPLNSVSGYTFYKFGVPKTLSKDLFVPHSSCTMVRTQTLVENNLLFEEGMQHGEDVNFWIKIGFLGGFLYCDYPGAVYHRDDSGSLMNLKRKVAKPMPDYLKGLDLSKVSKSEVSDLMSFLRLEGLKAAYQNRGLPLNKSELRVLDESGVGLAFKSLYVCVRFSPDFLVAMSKSLRRFASSFRSVY